MQHRTLVVVALFALVALAAAQNGTDHCSPYTTCPDCIAQQYCGWCSTPVIGGDGKQCAGFNPNSPTQPFICVGTYSTTDCSPPPPPPPPPPPVPPPPITPTTPTNVLGSWRGLEVDTHYIRGEWDAFFGSNNLTLVTPNGDVLSGNVSSDTMNLNIKITSGPNTGKTALGIYEVDFGPVCTFLTWAVSNPGVPSPPPDFMSAMNSTTATVYVFEQPKPQ